MRTVVDFSLTFPIFALTLADGSGTISLEADSRRFLPLFTDRDSARAYLVETGDEDCDIEELPTPKLLAQYLHKSVGEVANGIDWIVFDPIARGSGVFSLVPTERILRSISRLGG